MTVVRLVSIVLVLLAILTGAAQASGRVALVIGNGDYENVGRLANPTNDAADLASALSRIGFDVTLHTDLDQSGMLSALQAFSRKAQGADMAVVYFGGHGIEVDQANYLIPTDARLESDAQVKLETIALDLVTDAVGGASGLRMVILDACRNNPFIAQMTRSDRAIGRGLNRVEPVGGTLLAYSAKAGTVADDGKGRNSPFMAGLLAQIEQPGLDVSLMFRKVRDQVLIATNNRQEPFTYGSLPGDEIYLVAPEETEVALAPEPAPASQPAATSEQEDFAWSLVKDSGDVEKLQQYLFAYPRGVHVPEAIALIRSLSDTPSTLPTSPSIGAGETIKAIQSALAEAGCSPGAIDGDWGRRSRAALARYGSSIGESLDDRVPDSALLELLRSRPGLRCAVALAPQQTEPARPQAPTVSDCAIVSVRATPLDPNGDIWDWRINGNPEPDIVISELTTGQSARCDDSFSCSLRAAPVSGSVALNIVDYDNYSRNQLIGEGQCKVGSTCRFSNATVTVKAC